MPKYSVIIQYDEDDEIYVASVPELNGCMAHGQTQEEAVKEINVAMKLWIDCAMEEGEELPEPFMYDKNIA